MISPRQHKKGIVALLDALGTAAYRAEEIEEFLKSRDIILRLAEDKAEQVVLSHGLSIFTFNDTIIIAYANEQDRLPIPKECLAFFTLLRKFMMDSLQRGVLLRGAISIGTFYTNEKNTIMGEAISDAAAWFSRANWIGIYATPRTTVLLEGQLTDEQAQPVMLDFEVPMKDGTAPRLKTVNWPKGFWVEQVAPPKDGRTNRSKALGWLAKPPIPKGSEDKIFNTIKFLDYALNKEKKRRSQARAIPIAEVASRASITPLPSLRQREDE